MRRLLLSLLLSVSLASLPAADKTAEILTPVSTECQDIATLHQEPETIKEIRIPQIRRLRARLESPTPEEERTLDIEERWYALRLLRAPEVLAHRELVFSTDQRIERDTAGVSIPVGESSRLVLLGRREAYAYDPVGVPDESAFVTGLALRYHWNVTRHLQTWLEAQPYTGSDTDGIGLATGLDWQPLRGLYVALAAKGWQPWTENTLSVMNDGWQHGMQTTLRLECTRKLSCSLSGQLGWYGLGSDAREQDGYAGRSDRWSARMEYSLWQRPDRVGGYGFWNTQATYEDTVGTGLIAFANCEQTRYHMNDDFTAVPITAESMDIRVGVLYNHAVSRHWLLSLEGHVGQDDERDIPWGKLWGGSGRIVFIPKGHTRIWGGYGVSSTAANAVATGKERTLVFGVNMNF